MNSVVKKTPNSLSKLCVDGDKRGKKGNKPGDLDRQKQQLKKYKKMMIQCCGRKSCINVVLKKKPNSTLVTQVKRKDSTKNLSKRPVTKSTLADNREQEDNRVTSEEAIEESENLSSLGVASEEKQTTVKVEAAKSSAEPSTESLVSEDAPLKSEDNLKEKRTDASVTTFLPQEARKPEIKLPESAESEISVASNYMSSSSQASQTTSNSGISSLYSSAVAKSSSVIPASSMDSVKSSTLATKTISSTSTKSTYTIASSTSSTTSAKRTEITNSPVSSSTSAKRTEITNSPVSSSTSAKRTEITNSPVTSSTAATRTEISNAPVSSTTSTATTLITSTTIRTTKTTKATTT